MTGFSSTSMRQLAMLTLLPALFIMIVGCPNVVTDPPPGQTVDTDGDGVPDTEDKCAEFDDSEDRDEDGLPDACDDCPDDKTNDTDDDGVCDGVDKCPGEDDKEDADGDNIPDACDNCPDDTNKVEPGDCGCGVVEGTCQECLNDNDCDDGVDCTSNNCDTTTYECFYIAVDSNCDNGLHCDGVETCDAIQDCQSGTAVDCADEDDCTIDTCDEAADICSNVDNPADADGDGTIDCFDACPDDPNKTAEGVCGCNVADDDFDEDGVEDCIDNCPGIANATQSDFDLDNIGDDCDNCLNDLNTAQTDTDADGAGDVCDDCPNDPDKTEAGICGCNVEEIDTDADGDGTIDCVDECPDTPTGVTIDANGCPTGPTRWESSRWLSSNQSLNDIYNFSEDKILTNAEVNWDEDDLATRFSGTVQSTASRIRLGESTIVYLITRIFENERDSFASRFIKIDVFSLELDGNTATWNFDYTITDYKSIPSLNVLEASYLRLVGNMTGEVSESRTMITFDVLNAQAIECETIPTNCLTLDIPSHGFGTTVIWTLVP